LKKAIVLSALAIWVAGTEVQADMIHVLITNCAQTASMRYGGWGASYDPTNTGIYVNGDGGWRYSSEMTLVQWTLPARFVGGNVTNALFILYLNGACDGCGGATVRFWPVIMPWTPSSYPGGNAANLESVTTNPPAFGTAQSPDRANAGGNPRRFNVTPIAQYWAHGSANYGLAFWTCALAVTCMALGFKTRSRIFYCRSTTVLRHKERPSW